MLAGTLMFAWPAFVNGYPIVFSDTGGFLEQALMPDSGWDKPWIYGPFLTPFHARLTLWPAIGVQCLILSAMLWMTAAALGRATPVRHLLVCLALAIATAAPWFASLLMPDVFTPVAVLGLFVLGWGGPGIGRWGRLWVAIVTAIAIASHLSHLPVAVALLAALWLARRRLPWVAGTPVLAAVAMLLAANMAWFGLFAISPYGGVFALARMVADGPARQVIEAECPAAGWRLCAWAGRLPTDSDAFLWDPNGPVWADGYGPLRIAPEADHIVRQTILRHPFALLAAAARNTLEQLLMVRVGDALTAEHLQVAVRARLAAYFPPEEAARFDASLQVAETLRAFADTQRGMRRATLCAAAVLCVAALLAWRRDSGIAMLALLVLLGVLGNAAVTGGLSGPHARYQSRIAWLVLVPPLLAIPAIRRRREDD